MISKWSTLLFVLQLSSISFANEFLPENSLNIGVDRAALNNMSEAAFNQAIDSVEKIYSPIVGQMGGRLKIVKLWQDGTVNASASREGGYWMVRMFGGLARHPAVSVDALTLVACHEVGHHIGGAPKYSTVEGSWASVEGQSDYFATTQCLWKVLGQEDNTSYNESSAVDPVAARACDEKFNVTTERGTCKRISMAAMSSGRLFANLENVRPPKFETPDQTQVSRTFESHPHAQCRLDTYFNGIFQNPRPHCWYAGSDGGDGPTTEMPLLNNQEVYNTSNPNETIQVKFDTIQIPNAATVFIEVSRPNTPFVNPNGTTRDPNSLGGRFFQQKSGTFWFTPRQDLPGWGTYYFRLFALDARGQSVVGPSSNSSQLNLTTP